MLLHVSGRSASWKSFGLCSWGCGIIFPCVCVCVCVVCFNTISYLNLKFLVIVPTANDNYTEKNKYLHFLDMIPRTPPPPPSLESCSQKSPNFYIQTFLLPLFPILTSKLTTRLISRQQPIVKQYKKDHSRPFGIFLTFRRNTTSHSHNTASHLRSP
jgi:hypothetical protein